MTDIDHLVAHIRQRLGDLNIAAPGGEYHYASLPPCVIDAVFSLGVRYESVQRTVREWCARYGWQMERSCTAQERKMSDFLQVLKAL